MIEAVNGLDRPANLAAVSADLRRYWAAAPGTMPCPAFKVGVLSPALVQLMGLSPARIHLESNAGRPFKDGYGGDGAIVEKSEPLRAFADQLQAALFPSTSLVVHSIHLFDNKAADELRGGYATGSYVHRDSEVFRFGGGIAREYNAGINIFVCNAMPGTRLYDGPWQAHDILGFRELDMYKHGCGGADYLQGAISAYEAFAKEIGVGYVDTAPFEVWVTDSDMAHRALGMLSSDPVSAPGRRRTLSCFYRWMEPARAGWAPPS